MSDKISAADKDKKIPNYHIFLKEVTDFTFSTFIVNPLHVFAHSLTSPLAPPSGQNVCTLDIFSANLRMNLLILNDAMFFGPILRTNFTF